MIKSRLHAEWKPLVLGLALAGVGFFFLFGGIVDGWEEFRLIQGGKTAPGFIIDTWEEPIDTDAGATAWSRGATYTYRLPDGREFERTTYDSGRLKEEFRNLVRPFPVEVEYLPDEPTISRIKGDGPSSILGIFSGALWPYGYMSAGFLIMGGYALWVTIRGMHQFPASPSHHSAQLRLPED